MQDVFLRRVEVLNLTQNEQITTFIYPTKLQLMIACLIKLKNCMLINMLIHLKNKMG